MAMSKHGVFYAPETVCENLSFPEGPVALPDGSVVLVEIAEGLLVRITREGKKSVVANLGGGPNSAAIGPDGAVYVCNNGGLTFHREPGITRVIGTPADYSGGRIERVELNTGRFDRVYNSCEGIPLNGPNDLVFDRHGGFYFTDHGKVRERSIDRGRICYARPDGSMIRTAIFPMSMPNGIALSPDEGTLYIAETETARLWAYRVLSPGEVELLPFPSPNGGRLVHGAGGLQRFDSMKVEASGRVCVGTLQIGGITTIDPVDGFAYHTPMPDRNTTNVCFGGDDLMTLYVTLSHIGKLARVRWPRPGHPLNFVDRAGHA